MGREDDEQVPDAGADEGADREIDPDDVPTVVSPAGADPMERARAAIRSAKLARGVDPDAPDAEPEPLPTDPVARAQAVLERAAATREEAARGKKALEAEARAREELKRLKAGGGGAAAQADDAPSVTQPAVEPARKRRL